MNAVLLSLILIAVPSPDAPDHLMAAWNREVVTIHALQMNRDWWLEVAIKYDSPEYLKVYGRYQNAWVRHVVRLMRIEEKIQKWRARRCRSN